MKEASYISILSDMASILLNLKGYSHIRKFWLRSLGGVTPTPFNIYASLYCSSLLLSKERRHKIDKYCSKNNLFGFYAKAWSRYLVGDYRGSLYFTEQSLSFKHKESIVLKALNIFEVEDITELYKVVSDHLARVRYWIILANRVETEEDFEFLEAKYNEAISQKVISSTNYEILAKLVLAAQRASLYDKASSLQERIPVPERQKILANKKKGQETLNQNNSRVALKALYTVAKETGTDLFMVSGTLLGFVRENAFLPHDSDLDLGIFNSANIEKFFEGVRHYGVFIVIPQRCKHCFKVKHINGTPIDLFIHYQDKDDYWHSGVKVSWHNSPFTLKKANFLGIEVNIPADPEKYLSENYGTNWRIPQKSFDSTFDCPNCKVVNQKEIDIYKKFTQDK